LFNRRPSTGYSEDVFETYTLRNTLEAMAWLSARRAATFGTQSLDATVQHMTAAVRADDRKAMIEADYAVDYELPRIERLHRELADAIRAGDTALAERLGGSHNTEDGEKLCQLLREREVTS
jgi:DNA-binding FadR family transcriptional regulator